MLRLKCIVLLLVGNMEWVHARNTKIVNGTEAAIQTYPYIVGISIQNDHICGGSIISSMFVITAAHCVVPENGNKESFFVYSGTRLQFGKDGTIHPLKEIFIHKEYSATKFTNDIALLQIKGEFEFSETTKPIMIAKYGSKFSTGEMCDIAGWGYLASHLEKTSEILQTSQVPLVDHAECAAAYKKVEVELTDTMICAGYADGASDTCQGDSGGPLVLRNTLIGIVSFGQDCAHPKFPGVYTDLRKFNNWIKKTVAI